MNKTYGLCKKLIANGYDKEDLKEKIDVFLLANRITKKQYEELIAEIDGTTEN